MTDSIQHDRTGRIKVFVSIQEFLNTSQPTGQAEPTQLGGFRGELSKGIAEDGELITLTREDLERGIKPNTLVIVLLNNPDRPGNIYRCDNPKRTGKFAAFMDEAEDAALRSDYLCIWADKVSTEFLPEKLEARGYTITHRDDGSTFPDCVKMLREASRGRPANLDR